jgi:biotin transport system substrate-specific component
MKTKRFLTTKELVICSLFTALIAVGAFIKIPTGTVPFTLQLFFTLVAGLLLGARLGTISAIAYLIIGLVGVPIFAQGGGVGYIFQPTFGYILGFCFGVFVTGYISDKKKKKNIITFLISAIVGVIVIYIFGVSYLYLIKNFYLAKPLGLQSALFYGWFMFVPNDIASIIFASFIALKLKPIVKKE